MKLKNSNRSHLPLRILSRPQFQTCWLKGATKPASKVNSHLKFSVAHGGWACSGHSLRGGRGSPLSPSLLSNQTGHCVYDANINPAPPHPSVSNNDPRKGKQNSAQVILLHHLDNCLNLPLFFAVGQLTTCVFPLWVSCLFYESIQTAQAGGLAGHKVQVGPTSTEEGNHAERRAWVLARQVARHS